VTQASGLAALDGTALGQAQQAHAAAAGRQAVRLAAGGVEGHFGGLEGRRGLFALIAPDADVATMLQGLGRTWAVEEDG
jgi:hypothetical protein